MKFHEALKVPIVMLLCSGLYLPTARKIVKRKYLITLSRIWGVVLRLASPVFYISYTLPVVFPDTTTLERGFNILAGISSAIILYKLYSFFYNVPRFERLITIWDAMTDDDLYPELRQEMLLRRKKTTDKWIFGFGSILLVMFALSSMMPLYTRKLEHPTAFPYSKTSPEFDIFVVYESIMIVSLLLVVHAYNCLLMQIVAFEDVLCNYLKLSLSNIFCTLHVSKGGEIVFDRRSEFEQDVSSHGRSLMMYREISGDADTKMRKWINLHQKLLRFHDVMREIYEFPLCIEFFGLVVVICLVLFLFVREVLNPTLISNFISYCVTIYTIFYVTCYYGDLTELSSESVFSDAFGDNWFVYPKKMRVAYNLIIMRCRTPMRLMAFGLYPLDSRSFGTIFRHSYSFLMFLLQISNRSGHDTTSMF